MRSGILYTATATARGGQGRRIRSSEGVPEAELALPREPGGLGGRTDTERPFVAGYAAWFERVSRLPAKEAQVELGSDMHVAAHVAIGRREAGGFILAATLETRLDGVARAQAESSCKDGPQQDLPLSACNAGKRVGAGQGPLTGTWGEAREVR